jgi:hypothetical protein
MAWFRRKKPAEYEIISNEIPMSTILRWYLYDTGLDDANKLAEFVGLNKVSEEGDIKEQEDSDLRIGRIMELMPYIDAVSDISAATMAALHQSKSEGDNLTDEERESTKIIYKAVSMSTLIGALSIGINIGVLDSGALSSGRIDMDIDYE